MIRDILGVNNEVIKSLAEITDRNRATARSRVSRQVVQSGFPSVPVNSADAFESLNAHEVCVSKWAWRRFGHPGRTDDMNVSHWRRADVPDGADHDAAKFCIPPSVVEYTDASYEKYIKGLDETWSREETDYLIQLCKDYQLKFPVINDRWDVEDVWERMGAKGRRPPVRTLEAIRYRYCQVLRALLTANDTWPGGPKILQDDKVRNALLRHNYDPEVDTERKKLLDRQMMRTEKMKREEKVLLELIRRNTAALKRRRDETDSSSQPPPLPPPPQPPTKRRKKEEAATVEGCSVPPLEVEALEVDHRLEPGVYLGSVAAQIACGVPITQPAVDLARLREAQQVKDSDDPTSVTPASGPNRPVAAGARSSLASRLTPRQEEKLGEATANLLLELRKDGLPLSLHTREMTKCYAELRVQMSLLLNLKAKVNRLEKDKASWTLKLAAAREAETRSTASDAASVQSRKRKRNYGRSSTREVALKHGLAIRMMEMEETNN